MKILFVTGIFPPDHGGPARYVPSMAAELKRRGHEVVTIVTLSDRLDCDDSAYGFPIVRLRRSLSRPVRVLQTIWTITRHARRADVAYLNGLVLEGIVATRLLGRTRAVIKVVGDLIWERARNSGATELDLDAFQVAPLLLRWRILRWLQGWYTARAELVIVPSEYLATVVCGWGVDPGKVRVIRNAVPLPPPAPAITPSYDLVTVARLVPWKGVADLIDVAAENGWSLRVVGDGPLCGSLNNPSRPWAQTSRSPARFRRNVSARKFAARGCSS
ncbi:MAG: glycosyltransferase [Rhizobiales bacterium]|nr:glycosyltransferase [Hyphomicrobiales bacterium]